MIQNIIEGAINKRRLVVLGLVVILLLSVFSLKTTKVSAIPDIGENQQIVFTVWDGRSPKDVEDQITYPLSQFLQGIPRVKTVRGMSAFGLSIIYVIFDEKADFYWSRTRLLEKLATAQTVLPARVAPSLGPDATGLGQIYAYTLENKKGTTNAKSLANLRTIQDFFVKYLLQGVDGVSEIASIGGHISEYQVDIDPQKMFAFDIHIGQIVKAIQNSNLDVGAKVIEDGEREMIVRGVGFFKRIEDIESVVVKVSNNTPVRIKDIGRVALGPKFRRGALDKNGSETVGGIVTMRYGENPRQVISALKEKLKIVRQGLPKGVVLVPFYDQSELIDRTTKTVGTSLIEQIIITILAIALFLRHWKTSFLVSLTLPLGVGISFILMKIVGVESNLMSLLGPIIAIGAMVDMGIIMAESIYANLAKKGECSAQEKIEIIIKSAREVGPAILTAVLTTIVTFLPILALEGSEGKLFIPLAWSKTFAMAGSALVAIIIIPSLSVYFLKGQMGPVRENKLGKKIISIYRQVLSKVLDNRKKFLIAPLALLILGIVAFKNIGREFMPSLNEGDILYMPVTTADISITNARKMLSYMDKKLSQHPLVEYAVGKLGRADTALDPAPISMFETVIKLVDKEKWPRGMSIYDIMEQLDSYLQVPGFVNAWLFPIESRVAMISSGIKTEVGIKIFGDDLNVLEQLADEIGNEIKKINGSKGVYAEKINGRPYLEFVIDRIAASRYGLNVGSINKILQTAVGGSFVGQFFKGRERYPIRLRYKRDLRNRVDELKRVLIPTPMGQHIPLAQMADIKIVMGPSVIQSERGMLRSQVLFNVRGRDLASFVEEAQKIIEKKITLPEGYSLEWAGQYKSQIRANKRMSILIALSLLINLFIIFLGIRNFRNSAIIFSAVPIAFAGGLILLWIGGFNASVAVWVGFMALFGIAVDDGVLMMTYLQNATLHTRPQNWRDLKDCILQAGSKRIRPLIMTTTTTVVALLPVMWSTSTGSEIMKPMAIPTLGGMLVELITLFVVPVVFSYCEQRRIKC